VENIPIPTWPVKKTVPVIASSNVISGISNRKLVLDSAAFISRIQFAQYGSEYYTIPEVLKEVRDGKARAFMESLPITIKPREPTIQSYNAVVEFSKKTGDFPTLSKVDLKVLALAYQLEVEAKGSADHLRTTPVTADVVQGPADTQVYLPKSQTEQTSESIVSSTIPSTSTVTVATSSSPTEEESDDFTDESYSDDSDEERGDLVGFGDFGSDDDEGWIKKDNIKQYTKVYLGREEGALESDKDVVVSTLTADFAMQNVLLQLGLHLTSVNGVTIKKLQQWILRCFGCFRLCRDMTKLFCPMCGNNTLQRVQCSVGADGQVTLSNVKPIVSTRGTIYGIPKPKGGCKAKNLVLSPNSVPGYTSQHNKDSYRDLDDSFAARQARPSQSVVVGYGRRNPNEVRSKPGKRKKRRV
jgi:RNA-binding protein NOB1